jgi:hypothetical protein
LYDLLEMQNEAGASIEKLEAADFVIPDDLQQQIESLADLVAQYVAPTVQPALPMFLRLSDTHLAC